MSWFGFGGKKKKQKPEEAYRAKLDQLEKIGYKDRIKNLQSLKLYAGDVNLVIQDYQIQEPSSQSPEKQQPKQSNPSPQQPTPPPEPSEPNVKPVQPIMPDQGLPPPQLEKQEQKQEHKQQPKQEAKPEAKTEPKEEEEPPKISTQPKMSDEPIPPQPKAKVYEGAKMAEAKLKPVQPIMPDQGAPPKEKKKALEMLGNLHGLVSSDIRQVLLNIAEPQIGEIVFSNGIDGDQFYHFIVVNPILKKFALSFGNEPSYSQFVHQVELSYQKNGAIDIYNKPSKESEEDKKEEFKTKDIDTSTAYAKLAQNIPNLISSDVRLLILRFNKELAERMFSYSINGNDLMKFDYDGICFATGIKTLSKENWNQIVTKLELPQSEPFDKAKWDKLQKDQEALIKKAKNVQSQMKNVMKNIKPDAREEKAPPKSNKNNTKLYKQQMKQLNQIITMEKQTDKFLPQNLQKLKIRQLQTLTTLHDIASIIGLDPIIVNNISQSARRQSQKDLENYLKSVNPMLAGQSQINVSQKRVSDRDIITPEQIERRQLELLSTINKTRKRLEILAKQKGVNLEALSHIKSKIEMKENENIDINALNTQFDNLFQNLSTIAMSVKETAAKHGVNLNTNEIDKYLLPMYNDLEQKQNDLIAKLQYLNDQARMINPNAVRVNEEILHISGHAHTRTLSGPLHLSVPHSPGESPTPHDHFPDTGETKAEYDQVNSGLPMQHSRSPSLSTGIKITSPDETEREANQVRQRRKSLQVNSVLLKSVLNECDKGNKGYLSRDEFVNAVKGIGVEMSDKDMGLLEDVSNDKGVNIRKLVKYVEEQHLTLKLDSSKQWNSFRMKVICAKQRK